MNVVVCDIHRICSIRECSARGRNGHRLGAVRQCVIHTGDGERGRGSVRRNGHGRGNGGFGGVTAGQVDDQFGGNVRLSSTHGGCGGSTVLRNVSVVDRDEQNLRRNKVIRRAQVIQRGTSEMRGDGGSQRECVVRGGSINFRQDPVGCGGACGVADAGQVVRVVRAVDILCRNVNQDRTSGGQAVAVAADVDVRVGRVTGTAVDIADAVADGPAGGVERAVVVVVCIGVGRGGSRRLNQQKRHTAVLNICGAAGEICAPACAGRRLCAGQRVSRIRRAGLQQHQHAIGAKLHSTQREDVINIAGVGIRIPFQQHEVGIGRQEAVGLSTNLDVLARGVTGFCRINHDLIQEQVRRFEFIVRDVQCVVACGEPGGGSRDGDRLRPVQQGIIHSRHGESGAGLSVENRDGCGHRGFCRVITRQRDHEVTNRGRRNTDGRRRCAAVFTDAVFCDRDRNDFGSGGRRV